MDEIGLNVLIQFVGEYNEAINKYLNMQSNPGVSATLIFFFLWQKSAAEHHLDGQLQQIDLISPITFS